MKKPQTLVEQMAEEIAGLRRDLEVAQDAHVKLQHDWQKIGDDSADSARRRVEIRRDGEALEARINQLNRRLIDVQTDAQRLAEDHELLKQRKRQLSEQLASVGDGPGCAELEERLANIHELEFRFTRDQEQLAQARELRGRILKREGLIELVEPWVQASDGRIIPERRMLEFGITQAITVAGKGTRLPVEKAKLMGILDAAGK